MLPSAHFSGDCFHHCEIGLAMTNDFISVVVIPVGPATETSATIDKKRTSAV